MTDHIHTTPEDEHESAYSGLLVNDAHWAFGTAPVPDGHGEDPLFAPSGDKVYRHPTFYDIPDDVPHM